MKDPTPIGAEHTALSLRLDKWLWACRFYKTRSLAKDMIEGGKVQYNGQRVKASKLVEIGATVRVTQGSVLDVAVDIRKSSPTFGQHVAVELSGDNKRQLWVPEGFAHGFLVLSETAEFLYKTTNYYAPEHERSIIWNDPTIAINWPSTSTPLLSAKDQQAKYLADADLFD